jgi:hypothetical protein
MISEQMAAAMVPSGKWLEFARRNLRDLEAI